MERRDSKRAILGQHCRAAGEPPFPGISLIAENELPPLLTAAQEEGVTIFWIYLSSCLYEKTEIASYQAAHDVNRPLDRLPKSQRQAVLSKACADLIRAAQKVAPPPTAAASQAARTQSPVRAERSRCTT